MPLFTVTAATQGRQFRSDSRRRKHRDPEHAVNGKLPRMLQVQAASQSLALRRVQARQAWACRRAGIAVLRQAPGLAPEHDCGNGFGANGGIRLFLSESGYQRGRVRCARRGQFPREFLAKPAAPQRTSTVLAEGPGEAGFIRSPVLPFRLVRIDDHQDCYPGVRYSRQPCHRQCLRHSGGMSQ